MIKEWGIRSVSEFDKFYSFYGSVWLYYQARVDQFRTVYNKYTEFLLNTDLV